MTERIAQAGGARRVARGVYTASLYPPTPTPNRLQCSFLIFRPAGIPSAVRLPFRILRGFLEREANVKQTHRFR
jgi:hypothetical protein